MKKKCVICGDDFANHGKFKTCSIKCSMELKRQTRNRLALMKYKRNKNGEKEKQRLRAKMKYKNLTFEEKKKYIKIQKEYSTKRQIKFRAAIEVCQELGIEI